MKAPILTIDRKNKTTTITMPLVAAHPSKATGRTMVISTTRGLRSSTETYSRQPVWFTANVFFYPSRSVNSHGDSRDSDGTSDDPPRLKSRKHQKPGKVTANQKEKTA